MSNELRTIPSILVVSCSEGKSSKEIIADLLQGVCPPEPDYAEDNIDGYSWDLSTKYYTAAVKVCAPKHRTVPSAEFAESVEAVILYFDPKSRPEFVVMQSWLRTIDQLYSPAIKLLICEHSEDSDEVPRQELLTFCIDRHLELIELAPTQIESDDEEFGGNIHGYSRVRSALYAHTWSNLKMKPDSLRSPRGIPPQIEHLNLSNTESSSGDPDPGDSETHPPVELPDTNRAPQERDIDAFEELFSRLHQFRSTADSLTGEDRRKYAEQITKQFWKSLGDESDEFSDSDEERNS